MDNRLSFNVGVSVLQECSSCYCASRTLYMWSIQFHFVAQQLTNLSPLVQPEAECENSAAGSLGVSTHPLLVVRAVMCLLQLTSTAFNSRNSSLVPVQASLRWVSLLSVQPDVSLAHQTAVRKLLTTVRCRQPAHHTARSKLMQTTKNSFAPSLNVCITVA